MSGITSGIVYWVALSDKDLGFGEAVLAARGFLSVLSGFSHERVLPVLLLRLPLLVTTSVFASISLSDFSNTGRLFVSVSTTSLGMSFVELDVEICPPALSLFVPT